MIDRPAGRFTIRPEKVRILSAGARPDGYEDEPGTIRDVSYAGMVTRLHVALDAGGEIQVARQNSETTSATDDELRGSQVRVGWRREHMVAVGGGEQRASNQREKRS